MKKLAIMITISAFACFPTALLAKCPNKAPQFAWLIKGGDKRISGDEVKNMLADKVFSFGSAGAENYSSDGTYFYSVGKKSFDKAKYKFYEDGSRCINYASKPRFDLYVMSGKKLVLVNQKNERFSGKIKN